MASLGFDLLDRHVVAGRADEPALLAEPRFTFARLLEHAAAVGGALKALGVTRESGFVLDLEPGVDHTVLLCACVRIGVVARPDGVDSFAARAVEATTHVTVPGGDPVDLTTLRRAGATDPAGALAADAEGFRERALREWSSVLEPLLQGRAVE